MTDLVDTAPAPCDTAAPAPLPAPPNIPPALDRRLPLPARLLAAGAGLATFATRLPGLDRPRVLVFDEVYYASQGLEIATSGVEQGRTVHPPLAKWLIGAGIRVFGFDSFGWRIVPLLAGVIVVMATVVAAYRLFDRLWLAGLAGLIVMTDGIAFTTGRLALLDGILAAFTTLALAVLATAISRPLDVPLRRRATLASAVLLGCAVACKWSAAPLIGVAGLVLGVLVWRSSPAGPERRRSLRQLTGVLIGVPLAVYMVTYVPTLINFDDSAIGRDACATRHLCDPSLGTKIIEIVRDHRDVLDFHRTLQPTNRYAHTATSWVFQTEPVGLLKTHCPSADPVCSSGVQTSVRRIIGIGNPIIWALGTLALALCVIVALRRMHLGLGLIAAWAGALWLPWIIVPRLPFSPLRLPFEAARPGYTFYAAPLVPVLALGLAFAVNEFRGRWRVGIGATIATIALLGSMVLYPVWTAHPTSPSYLEELVG